MDYRGPAGKIQNKQLVGMLGRVVLIGEILEYDGWSTVSEDLCED